jgi:6-phosphogluconolactonase
MISKILRAVLRFSAAALLSFGMTFGAELTASNLPPKHATLVYVGTFTDTPASSKGIYLYWLRPENANGSEKSTLAPLGLAAETASPAFLALDRKRHLLFCANEISAGAVSAFAIDTVTGKLTFLNQQSSMGSRPAHLALDQSGRNILVANYNDGTIAVLPVAADGRLGEATCVVQDTGSSINPARQAGPHAHCVTMSSDNRFAFVCDLGIDKVMIFKFDAEHGKLLPNDPPFVAIKPGSGPRHLMFAPEGKLAYLISEMASTITALAYDAKAGTFKELQTISCLPSSFKGVNTAAEIGIAPSGKYLFASNRGDDNSVTEFAIDSEKGTLTWMGEHGANGKTPRYIGIVPSGKQLLVCNQDSDSVLMCGIDAGTGKVSPSDGAVHVPSPVCAVFLRR